MWTDNITVQLISMTLSSFGNFMLILYECIQIKMSSRDEYLSDYWNYIDWACYITYFMYLPARMNYLGEHLIPRNMNEIRSMKKGTGWGKLIDRTLFICPSIC